MDNNNTILLIADISGYTRFMKQHTIATSHAKQIIVRLLKALMQTAKPPLKVAELEGDAVFFYARTNGKSLEVVAEQVKAQVVVLLRAFKKELQAIDSLRTCACDACDHAHDLQLKQVIHAGNVDVERIERFEKLFGLDVILVHRMLKNSVNAHEYVMMTMPVFNSLKDFFGLQPERYMESFEGIGEVETLVFYPKQIASGLLAVQRQAVTPFGKLRWRLEITINTFLDIWGIRKLKGSFDGLPS
jgi:hypothetical protein